MDLESSRFLFKAAESLASAEADLAATRYNSCADRAYYAAFQAAIAALIHSGVTQRRQRWEHAFVMSEFSGTLIRRRRLVPSSLRDVLNSLRDARNVADYRSSSVSRDTAKRSLRNARTVVAVVNALKGG